MIELIEQASTHNGSLWKGLLLERKRRFALCTAAAFCDI
jgi:hypothetical protein